MSDNLDPPKNEKGTFSWVTFIFGVVVFVTMLIIIYKGKFPEKPDSNIFWFYKVLIALATSAVSISIPGMIEVKYKKNGEARAQGEPKITVLDRAPEVVASGAIAVFVLVLFV